MEMSALEAFGSLLYSGPVPTVVCQQPKALDAGGDYYLVIPVTIRVITIARRLERNIKEYGGRGGVAVWCGVEGVSTTDFFLCIR